MGPRQCEICKNSVAKYKCPTCFFPYCSLDCFRRHKEKPCSPPQTNAVVAAPAVSEKVHSQPQHDFEVDDENGWRLSSSQLRAVAASKQIRKLMNDAHIQKAILKIDSSENAEEELDKALEEPAFKDLSDRILSIINS